MNDFIVKIKDGAIAAQSKYGVPASLTIAQAILETGWGKYSVGNNIFGIKASPGWTGKTVTCKTGEVYGGQAVTVDGTFRAYDSIADSIADHARLIAENSRYHNIVGCKDFRQACRYVQADGYATDPDYADKLISIIESNSLNQFDAGSGMAPAGAAATLDTHGVYQLRRGGTYQLRVTCTAGQPTVATGNDSVCSVALRSHSGSNYYYALTGKGQPGDSTGIYVNRSKVSSLVVRITSACECDTGADMTRHVGECYTVGLTSTVKPAVTAGGAATVAGVFQDGAGHWLVPVVAVRTGTAEISTQVAGEAAVRRFAVRVVE